MENSELYKNPLIFNVYKPAGMSSFDVIKHFKKNLPPGYGKIGHFGTLDPFACGVLMVGVAGATRLANYVHEYLPKTYTAVGKFGSKTDTGDHTGQVVKVDEEVLEKSFQELSDMEIDSLVGGDFCDEYWQRPPYYSATKHEGKALYEYAREGVNIEKEPVKREIYHFEVQHFDKHYFKFICRVSSGTYIRTFFEDIAEKFETVGHLVELERDAIGDIKTHQSLRPEAWPKKGEPFDFSKALKFDEVLNLSVLVLPDDLAKKVQNGQEIPFDAEFEQKREWHQKVTFTARDLYWVKNQDMKLIGMVKKVQNDENQGPTLKVEFNLAH